MALAPKLTGASLLVFCFAFNQSSKEKTVIISVDSDTLPVIAEPFALSDPKPASNRAISILEVQEKDITVIASIIHRRFGRCGGFMLEESMEGALSAWNNLSGSPLTLDPQLYRIKHHQQVLASFAQVDSVAMASTIERLSSYRNRYYRSRFGVESQEWVLRQWQQLAQGTASMQAELYEHRSFAQPSVILTWKGSERGEEVLILGGHGDSIAGWFPGNNVLAPGADDNASGIATITEVIRVLSQQGFSPARTIKFISYAAEEVGLRGSKEIAENAANDGLGVVGVMQLDMTNFMGSNSDIVLMSDYTNAQQNQFIGALIDEYLSDLTWSFDTCGYACSDHASWTRNGFPASFPFESTMDSHNPHIHTSADTMSQSGRGATHASKFAKLALAYIIELAS